MFFDPLSGVTNWLGQDPTEQAPGRVRDERSEVTGVIRYAPSHIPERSTHDLTVAQPPELTVEHVPHEGVWVDVLDVDGRDLARLLVHNDVELDGSPVCWHRQIVRVTRQGHKPIPSGQL